MVYMVYWFHRFHKWMKHGCVLCVSSSDFVVHVEHDVLTMRKAVFRVSEFLKMLKTF